MKDQEKCYTHYRMTVAVCPTCHRGLCEECAEHAIGGHCLDCTTRERSAVEHATLRREARLTLRRAGVTVPHQSGDPVFLRADGHPLTAGIYLSLTILLAVSLKTTTTVAELH